MSAQASEPLPTEERDLAMGRFMDAWSELEAALRHLLQVLMKAPMSSAFSIAAAIPDLGRMRELLLALGKTHLGPDGELDEICSHLQISGKYRNSIVHGQWVTVLMKPDDSGSDVEPRLMWARIYTMVDKSKELSAVMGWDKGAQEQFVFSVRRLEERAMKARKLSERIDAFALRVEGLDGPAAGNP